MESALEIGGETIGFEFVRKPWIRNTYLKFIEDKLVVVARDDRAALRVLKKHSGWISKHYREIKSTVRLFDSNSIFYRTMRYPVSYVKSESRPRADISGDRFVVYAPSAESAERAIDRIIRKDTERLVGELALSKAAAMGRKFSCIKVRKCRKWGACKSNGALTFNYMISMLPLHLLDYIVSHEVAHLKELNHSRRFWEAVSTLCPDYRIMRKELKNYDNTRRSLYLENIA